MRAAGFTLIEVMAALAVVAIGLGAAVRAAAQVAATAEQAKLRTAALWVAQDRVAFHRALARSPAAGTATGRVSQAGIEFAWRETVSAMSGGSSRRVEVTVSIAAQPEHALASLTTLLCP